MHQSAPKYATIANTIGVIGTTVKNIIIAATILEKFMQPLEEQPEHFCD
jgi:hypothetical protein